MEGMWRIEKALEIELEIERGAERKWEGKDRVVRKKNVLSGKEPGPLHAQAENSNCSNYLRHPQE